jgi:hypothetical protein
MRASHFDHERNWWIYCTCDECGNAGNLVQDDACALFCVNTKMDAEKTFREIHCCMCQARYIALEQWDTWPTLYRCTREEIALIFGDPSNEPVA